MTTTSSPPSSVHVFVPAAPDDTKAVAALRLGAYMAMEDGWISKSVQVSDGFYLATNADTTVNVDGAAYIYAGEGMLVQGDKTVSIVDAGETSVRAETVGFGAGCTASTSDQWVSLEATDDVTMQSLTDISVKCNNLIYTVEQHYHSSTESTGVEVTQGEVAVNLGDQINICPMLDVDIATVGFEPMGFEHSCAVFSISSSLVEMSSAKCEMENHGLRAFLVGMFVPFSEAEAKEEATSNTNSVVRARSLSVGAQENGASNDINAVAARSRAMSCNF